MNILITGVNGYIGRNLIYKLKQDGFTGNLFGIDKEIHSEELNNLNDNISLFKINLLDTSKLKYFFESNSIDIIYHFAGIKYARQSDQDLNNFYDNNVRATQNLLEALRCQSVKKFVFSSSCSVYGPSDSAFTENSILNPISFYAKNKVDCEQAISDMLGMSNTTVYILRYFNVVGAESSIPELRDNSPYGLFSNTYKSLMTGSTLDIFAANAITKDNTCIRDYIDVRDLNSAHIRVLDEIVRERLGVKIYNLGGFNQYSSLEIVDFFAEIFNKSIQFRLLSPFTNEPAISLASREKFSTEYDWNPQFSITDSIRTFS
jgi:UDP-glucose 4-epimerase